MKGRLAMLCICIAVLSCSKEAKENQSPDISFQLNGKRISFDKITVSSQPFCGEMIYSISASNNAESFLISIVTDKLRPGTYQTGFNYWYQGGAITSSFMKVNIVATGATFWEDSLNIHDGMIAHKF